MAKRTYRVYSDEFKREALELVETSDKSVAQIERDLGISSGLLYKWRDRYQVSDEDNDSVIERSEIEQLRAELRELKRENTVLRQERDILKKTVRIFSQDDPR
jgi:transposase